MTQGENVLATRVVARVGLPYAHTTTGESDGEVEVPASPGRR